MKDLYIRFGGAPMIHFVAIQSEPAVCPPVRRRFTPIAAVSPEPES